MTAKNNIKVLRLFRRDFLYEWITILGSMSIIWGILFITQIQFIGLEYIFPETYSPEVTVIELQNDSLMQNESWPISRERQSQILQTILDLKPKKLGIDVQYNTFDTQIHSILEDSRTIAVYTPATEVYNLENTFYSAEFKVEKDGKVRYVTNDYEYSCLACALTGKLDAPREFRVNINYQQRLPARISYSQLLSNPTLESLVTDKLVLFGVAGNLNKDIIPLPGYGLVSGVMLHGVIANQLLANFTPTDILFSIPFVLFGVAIHGLALVLITNKHIAYGFLYAVLTVIGLIASFAFLLSRNAIIHPDFMITMLLGTLIGFGYLFVNYTEKDNFKFRTLLDIFVSPQIAKEMNSTQDINTNTRKDVVVMFTDMRGFTELSESLGSEKMHTLLNTILGLQADAIEKYGGIVDKYIGDAVMAYWLIHDQAEENAVKAAIEIQNEIARFNTANQHNIAIGIGIHQGEAMFGTIGSQNRKNYTVIGDTVNTASRIESITKKYGAHILVSNPVAEKLDISETYRCFELDTVYLKGKNEGMKLHEIVVQPTEELELEYVNYEQALDLYYQGNFELAHKLFKQLHISPAQSLLQRTTALQDNPPTEWNGVWKLATK